MSSRSIEDLNFPTRERAKRFLTECAKAGITVLIYCTKRSSVEQDGLYAIGRSLPGKIVTNAKGGDSWHNHGSAFDFVPMVYGKPQWGDKELYAKCGAIAESCGLEWAGRWVKFKETAHCQYRGGLTLAQVKSGMEVV